MGEERAISRAQWTILDAACLEYADRQQLVAVDARYLAALEGLAQAARAVWAQSYVVGADGWEGVEAVPMDWENALHTLGAKLAALPPPGPPDA